MECGWALAAIEASECKAKFLSACDEIWHFRIVVPRFSLTPVFWLKIRIPIVEKVLNVLVKTNTILIS